MGIFSKQRRIVVNNRYTHASSMRNGGVMFRLTLKKLIILAVILLLLLVWAFFVGVLVGQEVSTSDKAGASAGLTNSTGSYVVDENTPPTLPDVAQAPRVEEAPTPPPVRPQAQTAPAAANTAKDATNKNTANDSSGEAVISPQELSFMSDLKDKPAPPDPASADETAKQRSTQPAASSANAQDTQRATTGADAGRPEDPAPKATTPPGPGIFDYQYQVAATTDLEGAKRLVGQLRAEGLRASMVQGNKDGSKLYRVHVDFRGTPSDTNQLREQLSKFGINRVLLKTKVATQ